MCDVKKRGASDRPSNYGYVRQAHAYLEADLILREHFTEIPQLAESEWDDLHILLCDADMAFTMPIHPQFLFDGQKPRVHGVWGRRAEGDITLETNFVKMPPAADFMDQLPWILRAKDFPVLRARVTQAVFSNAHRLFLGESSLRNPPVAWLRWRSRRLSKRRTALLRFWTVAARPLPAFFEPSRGDVEPFAELQIAWIDANLTSPFEDFTWSIAMGMVWRCAHPLQQQSLHDRSVAHVNLLFNNLFWLPEKNSYSWFLRRAVLQPKPKPDVMSGPTDRLADLYARYLADFPSAGRELQSFPLSRYHLELLRQASNSPLLCAFFKEIPGQDPHKLWLSCLFRFQPQNGDSPILPVNQQPHIAKWQPCPTGKFVLGVGTPHCPRILLDFSGESCLMARRSQELSTPEGAAAAAVAVNAEVQPCHRHPHGHKALKHWNALKLARRLARSPTEAARRRGFGLQRPGLDFPQAKTKNASKQTLHLG